MDGPIFWRFCAKRCIRVNTIVWYHVRFCYNAKRRQKTDSHSTNRINAPGALRVPSVPSEFDAFTGPKLHTAEWNNQIDLKNKKVALIGSGASAVQVIPSIVDSVETLHCYQRKPPYIVPRPQFNFPTIVKIIFSWLPWVMWLYRCVYYCVHECVHRSFQPDSIFHNIGNSNALPRPAIGQFIYSFSFIISWNSAKFSKI